MWKMLKGRLYRFCTQSIVALMTLALLAELPSVLLPPEKISVKPPPFLAVGLPNQPTYMPVSGAPYWLHLPVAGAGVAVGTGVGVGVGIGVAVGAAVGFAVGLAVGVAVGAGVGVVPEPPKRST